MSHERDVVPMTGVYERALGDAAGDLHPKVRERYGIGADDGVVCVGHGEMDITHGKLALPALYAMPARNLLFPEQGERVPFTVETVGWRDGRNEVLTTRRVFDFDRERRVFDSLTLWDEDRGRLFDFLGTGGLLASELHPRVEDGALVVEGGKQWAHVGARYVPLPGPLAADVTVTDRYDDDEEQYHVEGTVESPLVGEILTYRGTFTQAFEELETVPDELKPTQGLSSLP